VHPLTEQLAMVRRIALTMLRHLPSHVELDDLVSLGHLGLIEARQRFDSERGVPFVAFAAQRIKGAMLDGLRRADPLSRDDRARVRAEEIEAPVFVSSSTFNVEDASDEDGHAVSALPDEFLARQQVTLLLKAAVAQLPERERFVARRYFFDEQPLKAIGQELGVSESRASQVVSSAVALLKKALKKPLDLEPVLSTKAPQARTTSRLSSK
jgi:RNA polymerase sigma factor for flagellar operon FliA